MRSLMKLVVLVGVIALAGCSGPDEDNGEHSNVVEPDAGQDLPGDSDNDAEGDGTCEPISECSADECGLIDDGCGGTLECGECGCIDGEAQFDTCGACDLGVLVCGSNETGVGICDEPEIPGLSGDCEELVFVSQSSGSSTGLGSKNDPVDSLKDGVGVAQSSGAIGVVVGGSAVYEGPVKIDRRLSIIGGYTDAFVRDVEQSPVIKSDESVEGLGDEDIVGLSSQGVSQAHVVEYISIETDDVEIEGGSNYGVHVYNSSGLILRNVTATAGRGGDGVDGEVGENGEDGEEGLDAYQVGQWFDPMVGEGGENPDCPAANGGAGGETETDGEAGDAASGGSAGQESETDDLRGGGDGSDGPLITSIGNHGASGSSTGEIVEGRWVPLGDGGMGEQGPHGSGGGGGGGGGISPSWTENIFGSHGGGGGAGGCGGEGGRGGTGGGGSFGLFVVNSDIDIIRSSFFANPGGMGGHGALGRSGGFGAEGGEPMTRRCSEARCFDYEETERGGVGGKGADGGTGGAGGGGAGGVSYGAYCWGSEVSTTGTVRFTAGGVSQGGNSPGLEGENGHSEDSFQCD